MSQADSTHSTTPPEIPADAVPRAAVERAIEALVALLDALDPDPDLEPNGDEEPSLGWTGEGRGMGDGGDDRELDTANDEPSLGWQNTGSQARLRTSPDDCEEQCEDEGAEHDGREPDYDNEVDSWPNPMGPHVGARP
jgi:hypothetical protein